MDTNKNRRSALKKILGTASAIGLSGTLATRAGTGKAPEKLSGGKIKHSASRWCYNDIPLETLCIEGKKMGLQSVELVGPDEWPVLKKHGLTCAMGNGAQISIAKGWNDPQYHSTLIKNYEEIIPVAAKAGIENIICLSGNRNGMTDEEGMDNCVTGLSRILGLAEKHKVNIVMELLNSKIDHEDYMCDYTKWGVELCDRIASDRFKLLYDIYHMQIMEGDIIRTIRDYHQYIAHYHTGGVPGRNEIDETQELNYPAIMRAIEETGYEGFVGQEFVPTWDDKLESLKQSIEICTV